MEDRQGKALRQADLDHAVRAVATILGTDEVVVVGSQALLVLRDDIDRPLRHSLEFDVFAPNALTWQADNPDLEQSEHLSALVGEGTDFHDTHGFFIDGVDAGTAMLRPDWRSNAIVRMVSDLSGKHIRAVAPHPTDLVSAKLHRADPKDIEFASRCLRLGMTTHADVLQAIRATKADAAITGVAETALRAASRHKNDHVAAKGPSRPDSIDVMLDRMRARRNSERD